MTLSMSNGQYIWGHRWQDAQTVDVGDFVNMVEELRLVWYWESFWGLSINRKPREKVFITIKTWGQVEVGVNWQHGADYKKKRCYIHSQVIVGLNLPMQSYPPRVRLVACQDSRHQGRVHFDERGVVGEESVKL